MSDDPAGKIDASYAVYDEHPLDEPDDWGDLASFREAAASAGDTAQGVYRRPMSLEVGDEAPAFTLLDQSGSPVSLSDFEGRKVRVVSISGRTGRHTPYSARLDLDLGDEYVVLLGYFSRSGEFIEKGREHPFQGPA